MLINAPGHGRSKIYGIHGSGKSYLRQKMCMIGTKQANNKVTIMNVASMICEKNKVFRLTFSEVCIKLCYSEN